ncbi:unnamed protein product [Symbiodinium microadriaticum]|nr:unnamed protein product [Symbiodinium microadriaticum]
MPRTDSRTPTKPRIQRTARMLTRSRTCTSMPSMPRTDPSSPRTCNSTQSMARHCFYRKP